MEKITVLIFVFSMIRIAAGEVSMRICEADGVTPFEGGEIMVGTKLTIIVSSDSGGFWNGGLFITDQKRAYGVLSARGFDPNTGDWADSHYEAAGETAMVSSYRDSWMWGFDLCTDSDAEAGDWFIIDYTAIDIGDPNVGFYEYHISWDDPNLFVDISHVATRDFNDDDIVNLLDYNMLASNWVGADCSEPNWCYLTDISRDGEVDILDLALFTEFWLWESLQPNQMGGGKGGDPGEGEDPNAFAYAYVITVGQSISKETEYDFNTINDAIAAMPLHTLDADHRGCIQVYPGTYIEQLNDFYPHCHNLHAHCDLIGMGAEPQDVIIQHQRRGSTDPDFAGIGPEIYAYGVKAQGDNLISHLSVRNVGFEQNSLLFYRGGTLDNCLIVSQHDAVTANGHLKISGGTIKGKYRPCVHAFGSFEISDCTIIPDTRPWGGEHPAGIKVTRSGTIDNVTIRADVASSDYEPHYDTPWLAGVITQLLNPDDTVTITNSSINLTLTTLYHDDRPTDTAAWELFGVVSGGRNPSPTTKYPGKTIIEDCQINLTGIEDSSNPNGDGRGIMVAGVCLQGGGEIEILGKTDISTSRTTAGFAKDGYEYSLNNQNGEMVIEHDTVKYDSKKTNGIIKEK